MASKTAAKLPPDFFSTTTFPDDTRPQGAIFFSGKSKEPVENSQDIVITYEDNDYIMRPSADRICQEETSGAKYYDRMVTAFLRREPSEDELQALVDSVNGTLTGQIRGAVD